MRLILNACAFFAVLSASCGSTTGKDGNGSGAQNQTGDQPAMMSPAPASPPDGAMPTMPPAGALPASVSAQGQLVWLRQLALGPTNKDRTIVWGVAAGAAGESFAVGQTRGDLGGAARGADDGFLVKYDAAGNQVWAKKVGGPGMDSLKKVVVDAQGNVIVCGSTSIYETGSLVKDPADGLVEKFGPNGDRLWSLKIGLEKLHENFASVAVDAQGTIVVGGIQTDKITPGGSLEFNGVVVKLSPAGEVLLTKVLDSGKDDSVSAVAIDSKGNIVVGGSTEGDLAGPNQGFTDGYVAKLDPSGTVLWFKSFETPYIVNPDSVTSVAVDGQDRVYASGYLDARRSNADNGNLDAFVAQLTPEGTENWRQQVGTAGKSPKSFGDKTDESSSLAVDAAGNVFIAGKTSFDLAATSQGIEDAFVASFDVSGVRRWIVQTGTASLDWALSVAVNGQGELFVGGISEGSLEKPEVSGGFIAKFK